MRLVTGADTGAPSPSEAPIPRITGSACTIQ